MNETTDPVKAAQSCLAGSDPVALLRIYQFEDDVEAHDDALQKRLRSDFSESFFEVANVLDGAFGPRTELDVEDDLEMIPLCGVFHAASWNVDGTGLFLAAAHEDRETPLLLIVGVET